jgi:hypothetical protein
LQKKFKCRTYPKDKITFDYGKEHVLITTQWEDGKHLNICLNDQDIDKLIKYLTNVRGVSL